MEINSEILNPQRDKFWKLVLVFSILGICFALLTGRLIYIQVIESDKYKKIAKSQHESKVPFRPERGNIYDRSGKMLVSTIRSTSYAIDPSILKDEDLIDTICTKIEQITSIPKSKLLAKISQAKGSFVWLARGLSPDRACELDTMKIKGFIRINEPKRNYLYGSVASQIIGCTDIDNNGLAGIELAWDSVLKGSGGYVIMLRDAAGRLIPTVGPSTNIIQGKSLKLTIDIDLQRIAENELMLGVKNSGAESGTLVIMEPETGELLAMASYPSYDPNHINEIIPSAMKIRAINDVYEPGSTFKLITAAAALEENLISPDDIVDGNNGILRISDYEIKDDHPIGRVKFSEALEKSSNIVFSNVANSIPGKELYKYIRDFGFGLILGIELPGELAGSTKSPLQFDEITKRFTGFGYGIMATPLQIANAYSTVANKGEMMKPFIIKQIYDGSGYSIKEFKPQKIRKVISDGTAKTLTNLLCGVVERGTGLSARIAGFKIAGKTGTAQQLSGGEYSKQKYTASFAGFFPADNPKLVILIVLDKPQGNYYGGSTAAPIFRNIAKGWISLTHNILTEKEDNNLSISDSVKSNIKVPDIYGMKSSDAKEILGYLDIKTDNLPKNEAVINLQQVSNISANKYPANNPVQGKTAKENLSNKVIGLPVRNAVSLLQNAGIPVKISGEGKVSSITWETNVSGTKFCRLICK